MDADLYVPGDGWLHRADPRVKFLISVAMLVLCLVWRNWMFIAAILVIEHIMLVTDHVPAERIAWVWKILALIIVLIVVLWPIFDTSGTHVLWRWGWLRLTQENLLMAAVMGLRIPALGFACFITLFTTDQPKFIRGLVSLGVPYKAGLTLATYGTFRCFSPSSSRSRPHSAPEGSTSAARSPRPAGNAMRSYASSTASHHICRSSSPYSSVPTR